MPIDDGSVVIHVPSPGSPAPGGIEQELAAERQQRQVAQQALADSRRREIEAAGIAVKNSANVVDQARQRAMERVKNNFEEGNWSDAAAATADLADLAIAKRQHDEWLAQQTQQESLEQQQERWLGTQHTSHAAWIRANREKFFGDTDFQRRAVAASTHAAHHLGYAADDPRHAAYVEEQLGMRGRSRDDGPSH